MAEGRGKRRVFTAEFKMEAVRRMAERRAAGVSLTQIGRELEVRDDLLRKWQRAATARTGAPAADVFPGQGRLPSDEAELKRLERENARLKQEVAFLKTAAVDSIGRRNTPTEEVAMSTRRRRAHRSGRAKLHSPGRPPVGRREDRRRFWAAIARGCYAEAAGAEARVSWVVGARWFRQAGGMPPTHLAPSAPPVWGRDRSFGEREQLALLRAAGHGVRECARRLKRAPSTVSRELRRNAATRGGTLDYRATTAQWHADRAARRPKSAKLATHARLRQYVQDRLAGVIATPSGAPVRGPTVPWKGRRHGRRQHRRWGRAWSPAQIAHRLPLDFPDAPAMRVSHEAIYQALYVQGRGALRRELTACLRTGRALRVPRARTRGRGKPFVTPELLISARPAASSLSSPCPHVNSTDPYWDRL